MKKRRKSRFPIGDPLGIVPEGSSRSKIGAKSMAREMRHEIIMLEINIPSR